MRGARLQRAVDDGEALDERLVRIFGASLGAAPYHGLLTLEAMKSVLYVGAWDGWSQ
jgi:hypothetical protein